MYNAKQGDIIWIDLDPQAGHEQKGRRPAIVISKNSFNGFMRTMAMLCPITNTDKDMPIHVKLDDRTQTSGVIMCDQAKILDLRQRKAEFIEQAPTDIIFEVADIVCGFVGVENILGDLHGLYGKTKIFRKDKEIEIGYIRKMTIDDYEKIYALWSNIPSIGLYDIEDSKAGIEKYLKRNPNTCFVAENNGNIVGAILSGHDGRRGYINHAAVSLSERNKGIGTALVDSAVNALKQEGINRVAISVFKDNKTGNEFWENRGFVLRDHVVYRNKEL